MRDQSGPMTFIGQNIQGNMQYYSLETVPAYVTGSVWLRLSWLRMIYSMKMTDTLMLLAPGCAYSEFRANTFLV